MFLHSFVVSLMMSSTPSEVRIVLVDAERAEFASYQSEPHLFYSLIHTVEDFITVLQDLRDVLDIRMNLFAMNGVKNLDSYNNTRLDEKDMLPRIVLIMNNYSEFISMNYGMINSLISQLIEYSSAAGIHLVLSVTRASSDIIPSDLKNNFNTRVSFMVPSHIDSRTALNTSFASNLMGDGEMLITLSDGLYEYHGMAVSPSDSKISNVVRYMKDNYGIARFRESRTRRIQNEEPDNDLYKNKKQFLQTYTNVPAGTIQTNDHLDSDDLIPRFTGQLKTVINDSEPIDDYSVIDEKDLYF